MSVDVRCGDALSVLRTLPAESVHCVVTSPPYFGLRDYGTAEWEGGDADCDHFAGCGGNLARSAASVRGGGHSQAEAQRVPFRGDCGRCGAVRIDKQLGLEPTPEEYVEKLVAVFREVRRVLHGSGTLWLNLGSTYAAQGGHSPKESAAVTVGHRSNGVANLDTSLRRTASQRPPSGWKTKDLIPIPWLVGLALQRDGWWLRSDCLWIKGNPMPSSVTDRPTPNHEYVLLLSKKPRYFYDAVAVAEPASQPIGIAQLTGQKKRGVLQSVQASTLGTNQGAATRNLRTAWHINTQPYSSGADVDHFAVFPPRLPEIAILAGTSEYGCCPACLAPYERVVERTPIDDKVAIRERNRGGRTDGFTTCMTPGGMPQMASITSGWQSTCRCNAGTRIPCTVLDIFAGSGTVGQVAVKHRRNALLIELNPNYVELIDKRLNGVQQTLPLDGEAS